MSPSPSDQLLIDLQTALVRALEIADACRLRCIGAHVDTARAGVAELLASRGLGHLAVEVPFGSD